MPMLTLVLLFGLLFAMFRLQGTRRAAYVAKDWALARRTTNQLALITGGMSAVYLLRMATFSTNPTIDAIFAVVFAILTYVQVRQADKLPK